MAVIRRARTGEPTTDRVLGERADDVRALALETPAGVLRPGLAWAAGQTRTVTHGLGTVPRTWWPCRPRGGVLQLQEVARDAKALVITSATAGTCDLWVVR